jgi:hypothetical protein
MKVSAGAAAIMGVTVGASAAEEEEELLVVHPGGGKGGTANTINMEQLNSRASSVTGDDSFYGGETSTDGGAESDESEESIQQRLK